MDQDNFQPPMPQDFQPDRPERRETNPQGDRPTGPGQPERQGTAFHDEIYTYHQGDTTRQPGGDVGRVSDRVNFRKDASDKRESIVKDLNDAKKAMLACNDIVAQGGGPYSRDARGRDAYMGALGEGMKKYEEARRKADSLLFEVDPQTGRPRTDAFGNPVESNYNKALKQEYGQLQQEINQLKGQNSPEARRALQEKMQQSEDIKDLTRMSGYTRANRGLAELFNCANLQGEDLRRHRQAGYGEIIEAAKYDGLMRQDRNFNRHFARAQEVAGPAGPQTRPEGPVGPRPEQPRPEQPRPEQPRPEQPRPETRPEFGPTTDGRFRDGDYNLPNGQVVLEAKPGPDGRLVADPRDPFGKAAAANDAFRKDQGKLTEASRAAFRDSIGASDALNRQSIAGKIMENKQKLDQMPDAARQAVAWKTNVEQTTAACLQKQEELRGKLGQLGTGLDATQGQALGAMWDQVREPGKLDAWLADPKNKAAKDALEKHPKWTEIKATFDDFLKASPEQSAQLKALNDQVKTNKPLADALGLIAESQQLGGLYTSSVDTRVNYLDKLMQQKEVQDFFKLPADQKAASPLKDNADVKAAQQLLTELATIDKQFLDTRTEKGQKFAAAAAGLGVRFERPAGTDGTQTRPEQPGPTQPRPEASTGITADQENAVQRVAALRQQFIQDSNGGQQKLTPEKWAPIKTAMEKAVADANSIKKSDLDAVLGSAQLNYQNQLKTMLNMPNATAEQLNAKQQELLSTYVKLNSDLSKAIGELPADKKTALQALQTGFQTDVDTERARLVAKAQTDAGLDPTKQGVTPTAEQAAKLQANLQAAQPQFEQWLATRSAKFSEDKKAISPAYKAAMEAQTAFLSKPEGALTAQFAQIASTVEQLSHAGAISRMYYAQVLQAQGEADAAKTQLTEAIKDDQVKAVVNSNPEFQSLAQSTAVMTPEMEALKKEAAANFPELVKLDEAAALLKPDATGKVTKEQFAAASAKFEEAIKATEGYNAKQLREQANALQLTVKQAIQDVQEGKRTALTPAEQETIKNIEKLTRQAQDVSLVRYQYALAASDYGHKNNDEAAKKKAIELLESIEKVDPATFVGSPEIQGALLQARRGKVIDPATAPTEAFVGAATNTIAAHGTGLSDFFIPGASSVTNALTGNRAPSIPIVGPMLFGGGKEVQDRTVQQLAQAYLANKDATQAQVDQRVQHGHSMLREVASDIGAVGVGFGTRYGLQTFAPKLMQGPWYMKAAGLGLSLAAAGATKDVLADGQFGQGTDWLRGAGMYGGSLLLMRGMSLDPTRQALNPTTTAALEGKFGLQANALNGVTSKGLAEALTQQKTALEAVVKAGPAATTEMLTAAGVADSTAAANALTKLNLEMPGRLAGWGARLNPGNYFTRQAFSPELASQALIKGDISLAQFYARTGAGRLATVGGSAFAFGAGRDGLYIATGQKQADGSDYTLNSALTSMGVSGLQTTLSTMIMLPMAGGFIRGIPGGKWALDGAGRMVSAPISRIGGPAAVTAAGNLALVGASPTLRGLDEYAQANQLRDASVQAKKLVEEAMAKAEAEQKARQQQGR